MRIGNYRIDFVFSFSRRDLEWEKRVTSPDVGLCASHGLNFKIYISKKFFDGEPMYRYKTIEIFNIWHWFQSGKVESRYIRVWPMEEALKFNLL